MNGDPFEVKPRVTASLEWDIRLMFFMFGFIGGIVVSAWAYCK